MNRLQISLTALAFGALIFLNAQPTEAKDKFVPWDAKCIQLDAESDCNGKVGSFQKEVMLSPSFEEAHESNFFWKFIVDQAKQTSCEQTMLAKMALAPELATCHEDGKGYLANGGQSYPKVDPKKLQLQKTILIQLFAKLPVLSKKSQACTAAQKSLDTMAKNHTYANLAAGASLSDSPSGIATARDVEPLEKKPEWILGEALLARTCADFQSEIDGLWSGSSPEMQNFVKRAIFRFQNGNASVSSVKTFLKKTLPVDESLHYNSERADHGLDFQQMVLNPMLCKAKKRSEEFARHVRGDQVTDGANDQKNARIYLMKDGGQAALAFLQRTPEFRDNSLGLACQIKRQYWEIPERNHKIFMGAEISFGVGSMFFGGEGVPEAGAAIQEELSLAAEAGEMGEAAAATEAAAISTSYTGLAFALTSTTAAIVGSDIDPACHHVIAPESLQLKNICEIFKNTPDHEVPSNFVSELDTRSSCIGQVTAGVFSVAGALFNGPTAMRLLEKSGKLAKPGTEVHEVVQVASQGMNDGKRMEHFAEDLELEAARVSKKKFIQEHLPNPNQPGDSFAAESYYSMRMGPNGEFEFETPEQAILRATDGTHYDEWKRIEEAGVKRQIERYERAKADIEKLKNSSGAHDQKRAAQLAEKLKKDPVALGNGPHVKEILDNLEKHKESIRSVYENVLGRKLTDEEFKNAYQYMRTVVAVHDLGKAFPAEAVLKVAAKFDKLAFLKGRVAMHEISSAAEIQWLVEKNHLDPKIADQLVRDILGHNDGSGLPDVFWNQVAHQGLGDYIKPDSPFASLMAFVDRGGQATLGDSGGILKITNQEIGSGKGEWGRKLLENQTMLKNAQNTNRQMKQIVTDFEQSYGNGISNTDMVRALEHENQRTIDCFNSIKWNADNTSGTLAGQSFHTKDEFFKIISDVETAIRKQQKPLDFWSLH